MEVIVTEVHTAKSRTLPLQETILMPVGDIQFAGGGERDACDVDRFQRHIEWGMEQGAYFLGMGDYLDVASPSNRDRLQSAKFYDSIQEMIEEAAERQLEKFKVLIKGTEGHWLGLLAGDHYYEFEDGSTSDTRLASYLKAPFLGDSAMLRLVFKAQEKARVGCTIWCHHGTGGGRLTSAPLNLLEHVIKTFEADIYLIGHQHKKVSAPLDRIYVNWNTDPPRLQHRRIIIGCTGGFLRGYMQGHQKKGRPQGTYVEHRMLSPVALGGLVIRMRPRSAAGKYSLDLSVEQ